MELYKFLEDEKELKWFFDNVIIPPKDTEEYCFCTSARNKKLTDEEKEYFHLGRAEMLETNTVRSKDFDFERFKRAILKFEVNKEAIVTKSNLPYPDKALVCYLYINPCDVLKVSHIIKERLLELDTEFINSALKLNERGVKETVDKVKHFIHKISRLYPTCPSTKHYLDFDMDIEEEYLADKKEKILPYIKGLFINNFGRKNFFIINTSGGYHIIVKKESFKKGFNPKKWCEDIEHAKYPFKIKEFIFNTNGFIPCPGTLQYGNIVTVENKEDFND